MFIYGTAYIYMHLFRVCYDSLSLPSSFFTDVSSYLVSSKKRIYKTLITRGFIWIEQRHIHLFPSPGKKTFNRMGRFGTGHSIHSGYYVHLIDHSTNFSSRILGFKKKIKFDLDRRTFSDMQSVKISKTVPSPAKWSIRCKCGIDENRPTLIFNSCNCTILKQPSGFFSSIFENAAED